MILGHAPGAVSSQNCRVTVPESGSPTQSGGKGRPAAVGAADDVLPPQPVPESALRVSIIDDHPVTRLGIEQLLASRCEAEVVCSVGTLEEFHAASPDADAVFVDLYLEAGKLTQAQVSTLAKEHRVLVVSSSCSGSDVLSAVRAGALGYLVKTAAYEDFVAAVRTLAAGEFFLSSQLADIMDADMRRPASVARMPSLSPREKQTLRYIAQGMTYSQTARHMGVSPHTVGTYIKRIHKKFGAGNKTSIAVRAMELGELLALCRAPSASDR
jgi:DNA-binding NarL/FixJ family response regulator